MLGAAKTYNVQSMQLQSVLKLRTVLVNIGREQCSRKVFAMLSFSFQKQL